MAKLNVMIVCLGNICRSPLGGAVLAHLIKTRGLSADFDRIESCGTAGYHIGEEPDERSVAVCRKHGVPINSLAQQINPQHFHDFDWILASDKNNLKNLQRIQPPGSRAQVVLFGSFDDQQPIADPYYQRDGFEATYDQILRYCNAFLAHLGYGDAQANL
ncbi:uncharacterized protein L969DRAFT_93404 [Mixia osmundae IAM 14324]|uniref:Phosphotyrosine protein phosphatase I domain-containing protein n=1 Tax=Mixia osmundae (strain CBS 9802 / IAM 14324 / JCM 22182 / KY 12970) TaxID=764103 RepID=G7EAQ3_MIXOS|nr:uncharacterized protein L969DRAFT_93404 [Mixia osmundae IAM 14324]KEI40882.1 hypothetical protein L969DRAFT_93404 [Mixia osmundae IAM 14324]GAA99913.1 hypothetical protein E5Q_06616 [Mixia osmundae IAM 14324]